MISATAGLHDLVGCRYLIGGRDPATGIDCLGLVLQVCARRGWPLVDPWLTLREQWRAGRWADVTGFSPGWRRVDAAAPWTDGTVLLLDLGEHQGCAIVADGWVFTSMPEIGSYRKELRNWTTRPKEAWRHDLAGSS